MQQQAAAGSSSKQAGLALAPCTYACATDRAPASAVDARRTGGPTPQWQQASSQRKYQLVCAVCLWKRVRNTSGLLRLLREQDRVAGVKVHGRCGFTIWLKW